MDQAATHISVVIVSWNTRDLLRDCLRSIFDTMAELRFEVFVVDNASSDDSPGMVMTEFPSVRLIANKHNVGFARANNQALRVMRGQYALVLNPDTVLLPGMVARCLAFMEQNPATGIVGGELLNSDGSFQSGYFSFPTFWSQLRIFAGREGQHFRKWKAHYSALPAVREVDWVGGACMFVRRAAMEAAGLLDERFFMFSEETEWCYRIHRAGWKIHYLSDVKVIHHHRQSTRQVAPQMSAHGVRGQMIFFWTHYPRIQALLVTLLALALGVALIIKGLFSFKSGSASRRNLQRTGAAIVGYCLEVPRDQRPQIPTIMYQ